MSEVIDKRKAMPIWESRRPEIERLYAENFSQSDLAALYGISQPGMSKIMLRLGIQPHPAKFTGKGPERVIAVRITQEPAPVFKRLGWWNPAVPSVGGERRTVRGMGE
jgi:hypothetical protein